MNILVTGGAGFIGSNLVHFLLGPAAAEFGVAIDRVVTLDKLTYAGNRENLAAVEDDPRHVFVEGDICDAGLVADLLREHAVTAVMHLAAESHVDRSIDAPEEFIMTNVGGTFHLLESARRYLGEQPDRHFRFLHVSTDEVYGSLGPDEPAFSERTPYAPNSPYSASKAGSDHLARAYFHTYRFPVITTNCSNNYGPRQFPEKLIPLMIRKAVRGERLPVYGDGANIRDWLYVEDHCRALVTALLRGAPGEVYTIGGNCEMKNLDVVRTLVAVLADLVPALSGKTADDLIEFVRDRPGHDRRYAMDSTKIARMLGWRAAESFETGIRKTVQWYLDNEAWVRHIEEGTYRGERLGAG